jgi:hypothetical protein
MLKKSKRIITDAGSVIIQARNLFGKYASLQSDDITVQHLTVGAAAAASVQFLNVRRIIEVCSEQYGNK